MKLNTKKDFYLLMFSAIPSAALKAVIETGLLWQLARQPLSAMEIAQWLMIPGKRCYYWLQLLSTMGILENGPNGYRPSSLAREVILDTHSKESWQHLVLDDRERCSGINDLSLFISDPGSIWTAQGLPEPKNYVEKMRTNPERAREFTRMLYEVHQDLANQIAELLDLSDVKRMMDLGGGSGVVSMALLRKYPALTSTVVDIENVCIAGREIAAEEGLSDRISYHVADFATGEFPNSFDLILQCDVGVHNMDLYLKLFGSLKPGGRLVFVEHFSPVENYAPTTRVAWTFVDSLQDPNFSFPTISQITADLSQVGFHVSPEPKTIENGLYLLQANKSLS